MVPAHEYGRRQRAAAGSAAEFEERKRTDGLLPGVQYAARRTQMQTGLQPLRILHELRRLLLTPERPVTSCQGLRIWVGQFMQYMAR